MLPAAVLMRSEVVVVVVVVLLLLLLPQRAHAKKRRECPCRYRGRTEGQDLYDCKVLCKYWDKFYPRPATLHGCTNACTFFYEQLANDYETNEEPTWNRPICTANSIARFIRLPVASLPKNAAIAGCREVVHVFEKCMKNRAADVADKPNNLRGAPREVGDAMSHAGMTTQLNNWPQKQKKDPLL